MTCFLISVYDLYYLQSQTTKSKDGQLLNKQVYLQKEMRGALGS